MAKKRVSNLFNFAWRVAIVKEAGSMDLMLGGTAGTGGRIKNLPKDP